MKGQRSTFQTESLNKKKDIMQLFYLEYRYAVLKDGVNVQQTERCWSTVNTTIYSNTFFFLEIIQDCKVMK